MYKLVFKVNGVVRETLIQGPKALCNWKKKQVASRYTMGKLIIE